MLGKLIKYEFKATARIFALAYAVVVVLAGITAAILALQPDRSSDLGRIYFGFSTIMTLLFVIAAGAAFLLTFVIIVVRFYRMLGDEGYLWFTLPVTPGQQIVGKLIPAIVWTIVTGVVTAGSVTLVMLHWGFADRVRNIWHGLSAVGFNPGIWLAGGLIFILASLLVNVMVFYAAMATGANLIRSSRLGGSVVAYLIFYVALELVNLLVFFSMFALFSDIVQSVPANHGSVLPDLTATNVATINHAGVLFGTSFGVEYVLLAVVCFFITRHFIGRKLNLG